MQRCDSADGNEGQTFAAGRINDCTGLGISAQIVEHTGLIFFSHQPLQTATLVICIHQHFCKAAPGE